MITERPITQEDIQTLSDSLSKDQYHQGTTPEFFTELGTVCNVYEDDRGPVLYARGAKALRLDLHFVDSEDHERNATALVDGVSRLAQKARENGFKEIIVRTSSPSLTAFAIERFGFVESFGELRKAL